jgi:hypothetical protein
MKVPSERDVVSKLLDLKEAFGSGEVFERRCLRIGWRWHLVNLEGWAKPRDLEGAMRAIIEAAEATNQKDDVPAGQLHFDDKPPAAKPRPPDDLRCGEIRRSEMPQGKVYEERCIKQPRGHKGRHEYDGEDEVAP